MATAVPPTATMSLMVAFAPQPIQRQDRGQVHTRRSPSEERRDVWALHHLLFVVRDWVTNWPRGVSRLSELFESAWSGPSWTRLLQQTVTFSILPMNWNGTLQVKSTADLTSLPM